MITLCQIEIYKKYGGDGDGFIHSIKEKEKLDYKHWLLIDNFIQDLNTIKKGIASQFFIKKTTEFRKIL